MVFSDARVASCVQRHSQLRVPIEGLRYRAVDTVIAPTILFVANGPHSVLGLHSLWKIAKALVNGEHEHEPR